MSGCTSSAVERQRQRQRHRKTRRTQEMNVTRHYKTTRECWGLLGCRLTERHKTLSPKRCFTTKFWDNETTNSVWQILILGQLTSEIGASPTLSRSALLSPTKAGECLLHLQRCERRYATRRQRPCATLPLGLPLPRPRANPATSQTALWRT